MEKKEEKFKVVDKRFSSSDKEEKESERKRGEGFVMNEAPQESSKPPGQIDFSTFVFSLASGALINLGLVPDPMTKKTQKNVDLAKQNIDILELLKEKTKGNLTPEEDQLITSVLTETRLRYVECCK